MSGRRLMRSAAGLAFPGFLALDIWLVFVLPSGSWQDHAGLWFGLAGVFALATGFISTTGLAEVFDVEDITSPYPREYLEGNGRLIGLSFSFALALLYGRAPWEAVRRAGTLDETSSHWVIDVNLYIATTLLNMLLSTLMTLVWFAATAAYLILVVPVAYPAYAAVGFALLAIRDGDADPERVILVPGVDPRKVVGDHEIPLRAFAVGGLGTLAGFLLKASTLY